MRTVAGVIFWADVVAAATASSRDSVSIKRGSLYFFASSWPDSPRRMIDLI